MSFLAGHESARVTPSHDQRPRDGSCETFYENGLEEQARGRKSTTIATDSGNK